MRKRFRPPLRPNKVNAFLTDELFAELERHAEVNGETPGAFASRVLANHLRSITPEAAATAGDTREAAV